MNSRKIYRVCISDPADSDNSNPIYEGWILSRTHEEAINLVMKDNYIDDNEFKDRNIFDIEKQLSILDEIPLLDNKVAIVTLSSKMRVSETAKVSKFFLQMESGILAHRIKPVFPDIQQVRSLALDESTAPFDNLSGTYLYEFLVIEQRESYAGWHPVERSYYVIASNEYSVYEIFANFRSPLIFDGRFYTIGKRIHLLGISSLPNGIVGVDGRDKSY